MINCTLEVGHTFSVPRSWLEQCYFCGMVTYELRLAFQGLWFVQQPDLLIHRLPTCWPWYI